MAGMRISVIEFLEVLQQLLDAVSFCVTFQRPGLGLVEGSEVSPEDIFSEFASGVLKQNVDAIVELAVQDTLESAASGVQLF